MATACDSKSDSQDKRPCGDGNNECGFADCNSNEASNLLKQQENKSVENNGKNTNLSNVSSNDMEVKQKATETDAIELQVTDNSNNQAVSAENSRHARYRTCEKSDITVHSTEDVEKSKEPEHVQDGNRFACFIRCCKYNLQVQFK